MRMSPDGARGERLGVVLPVGLACAVYSYGYTLWDLPPQLPYGTFGLMLAGDLLPLVGVPLLAIVLLLRRPVADYGLSWPGPGRCVAGALLAWAALLPLVWVLSGRPEFQAAYPSPAFPPARQHAVGLAFLWLLHHAPQLFAVEFLFRGFLLQPLARARGPVVAIAVTTVPYVILHWTKPPLELAEAAWGGVVFGAVAWRTRSVWPAFAAHWAVAVSMDTLSLLAQRGG